MPEHSIVHVYGSGREFVVVPVLSQAEGAFQELAPAQHVNLTLGRPVVVELARALRQAKAQAIEGEAPAWDGEEGRWWAHHLMLVRVTWREDAILFVPQDGDREAAEDVLPPTTADVDMATRLVAYLGERLHR